MGDADAVATTRSGSEMMWLSVEGLAALHRYFLAHEGELQLMQFVDIMILLCDPEMRKMGTDEGKVAQLIELFYQIDVNGDASLEWEELSAYIIESGMAAGGKGGSVGPESVYAEQPQLSHSANRRQAQDVYYFRRGVGTTTMMVNGVCEPDAPGAPPSDGMVALVFPDIVEFHCALPHGGFVEETTHALTVGESGFIISFVMLPELNVAIACTTNLRMLVWELTDSDFEPAAAGLRVASAPRLPDFEMKTATAQRLATWSAATSTLFTAKDRTVTVWHVARASTRAGGEPSSDASIVIKKLCTLAAPESTTAHADEVTAMIVYPTRKLLVTGSFDGSVHVWTLNNNQYSSARRGHTKGIQALAISSDGVLLTAGFDYQVLGWSLLFGVRENVALFTLVGHTATVVGLASFSTMAYSMDKTGSVRSWDIRLTASVMEAERNLQTFTTTHSLVNFAPTAMCFFPGTGPRTKLRDGEDVVLPDLVGCDSTVYIWRAIPASGAVDMALTVAHYNATFMSIVVPTQTDVYTFSAINGAEVQHLNDVLDIESDEQIEISSSCFDGRDRKLIFGSSNGEICVHNPGNGAEMKRAQREVITYVKPKRGRAGPDVAHHSLAKAHIAQVDKVMYLCSDIIASISWDGKCALWDESHPRDVPMLRSIQSPNGVHTLHDPTHGTRTKPIAILAAEFSEKLSLLATGGADGSIWVWDFLSLNAAGPAAHEWSGELSPFGSNLQQVKRSRAHPHLQALLRPAGSDGDEVAAAAAVLRQKERDHPGAEAGIMSMCFLDVKQNPLPVLATGTSDGRIGLWAVRGNRSINPQTFIGRLFSSKVGVTATSLVAHLASRSASTAAIASSELPEAIVMQYTRMGLNVVPKATLEAPAAQDAAAEGDVESATPTTVRDDGEEGEGFQWLFAADENGWVQGWCVDELDLGPRVVAMPEERLPMYRQGAAYNPTCRLARPRNNARDDGAPMERPPLLPASTRTGRPGHILPIAPPHVAFQVSDGPIYTLTSVPGAMNAGGALLSLSKGFGHASYSIALWSLRGECLGRIQNHFSAEGMPLGLAMDAKVPWTFDPGHREKKQRDEARARDVCCRVLERHSAERRAVVMRDPEVIAKRRASTPHLSETGAVTMAAFPFPMEAVVAVDAFPEVGVLGAVLAVASTATADSVPATAPTAAPIAASTAASTAAPAAAPFVSRGPATETEGEISVDVIEPLGNTAAPGRRATSPVSRIPPPVVTTAERSASVSTPRASPNGSPKASSPKAKKKTPLQLEEEETARVEAERLAVEAKKRRRAERRAVDAARAQERNAIQREAIFAQVSPRALRDRGTRPVTAPVASSTAVQWGSRPASAAAAMDDGPRSPVLDRELKKRAMYANLYVLDLCSSLCIEMVAPSPPPPLPPLHHSYFEVDAETERKEATSSHRGGSPQAGATRNASMANEDGKKKKKKKQQQGGGGLPKKESWKPSAFLKSKMAGVKGK